MQEKINRLDEDIHKVQLEDTFILFRGTDGIIFGEKYQPILKQGDKINKQVAKEIIRKFKGTSLLEKAYLSTSLENQFLARRTAVRIVY